MTSDLHTGIVSPTQASSLEEPTGKDYEAAARALLWLASNAASEELGSAARALLQMASGSNGVDAITGIRQAAQLLIKAETGHVATNEPEPTDDDYASAAQWAETATFDPTDPTIERGPAAAEAGKTLLRAARGGRPALDAASEPGQASPVRRFRLPVTLDAQLNAYVVASKAHGQRVTPSDVIREALDEYLKTHRAS